MARKCVFCGKEIGLFGGKYMMCGGVDQWVCGECCPELEELDQRERGERVLATGRAAEPEKIMAFLERDRQEVKEAQARQDQARQEVQTDQACLRCGGQMMKYGRKLFHLGEEGLFAPVVRDGFLASWLEVDVLYCEKCRKVEFYLPEELKYGEPPGYSGQPAEKTFSQRLRESMEEPQPQEPQPPEQERVTWTPQKKKYRKPPWEK